MVDVWKLQMHPILPLHQYTHLQTVMIDVDDHDFLDLPVELWCLVFVGNKTANALMSPCLVHPVPHAAHQSQ